MKVIALLLLAVFLIGAGLYRYHDRLPVIEWAARLHSEGSSVATLLPVTLWAQMLPFAVLNLRMKIADHSQ